jgi:hypothetical protein
MESNRLPERSALTDAKRPAPRTSVVEGFVPDPNSPKFNAAVNECMEAFRYMVRKGGDEIDGEALEVFGASLDSYTLEQVNALTVKLRAHADDSPSLNQPGR